MYAWRKRRSFGPHRIQPDFKRDGTWTHAWWLCHRDVRRVFPTRFTICDVDCCFLALHLLLVSFVVRLLSVSECALTINIII